MAFDKNDTEYSSLKKKIKQIDSKIHELEKENRIEKKYSHSHSEELNEEIKHLMFEKRNLLKSINKIEKKMAKHKSELKP